MITPSQTQLDFIADVESGIAALKAGGRKVTRLGDVMTAAGREPPELSNYVDRLAGQGNWDLIQKLHDLFASVNLKAPSITAALQRREDAIQSLPGVPDFGSGAFKLEPVPLESIEIQPAPKRKTRDPETTDNNDADPESVLKTVIRALEPVANFQRERIIGTAARWYGVGS